MLKSLPLVSKCTLLIPKYETILWVVHCIYFPSVYSSDTKITLVTVSVV